MMYPIDSGSTRVFRPNRSLRLRFFNPYSTDDRHTNTAAWTDHALSVSRLALRQCHPLRFPHILRFLSLRRFPHTFSGSYRSSMQCNAMQWHYLCRYLQTCGLGINLLGSDVVRKPKASCQRTAQSMPSSRSIILGPLGCRVSLRAETRLLRVE